MKHLKEWVQCSLSEDQINLISDGNIISTEDCLYFINGFPYYKQVLNSNEFYMTFDLKLLPSIVQETIEELVTWTLDRIHGTKTIILHPIKGTRSKDFFFDHKNNEYWYCEQLEGPRTMKILVDTTPDIDVSISGGCPKSWIKTKGRFIFPDGQIIEFK